MKGAFTVPTQVYLGIRHLEYFVTSPKVLARMFQGVLKYS